MFATKTLRTGLQTPSSKQAIFNRVQRLALGFLVTPNYSYLTDVTHPSSNLSFQGSIILRAKTLKSKSEFSPMDIY